MTIGIYKLEFNGTDKVYIGQSLNIEKRFINHKSDMLNGTSSLKMQEAYRLYGLPTLTVLEECSISELDKIEYLAICTNNSIVNGFNTVKGGDSSKRGEDNSQAKYCSGIYKEILFYLVETSLSNKEIAEIVEVNINVVKHISDMSRHFWLEEEEPELYNKLVSLRKIGTKKCAKASGLVYPQIKSPTGCIYNVDNITQFAKLHGLSSGALCSLLNRKIRSTQGWCLATDNINVSKQVVSPSGEVFSIGYREAKPFAEKNGLHPGDFAKVLKGTASHSKGWKLLDPKLTQFT